MSQHLVFAVLGVMICVVTASPLSALPATRDLDAHFVSDRVLVDAPLSTGGHLRFWTDTGGGGSILYARAAQTLALATQPVEGERAEDLPPGSRQLAVPLPLAANFRPSPPPPIMALDDPLQPLGVTGDADGNLGQDWFAEGIWTWDYPLGRLRLERGDWRPPRDAHVEPIGFRPPAPGKPTVHFPRIVVKLDGEPTSMLLDTGATTVLTPEAVAAVGGGPTLRATSMITASRLAEWRRRHPAWRVIERAQKGTGSRMIQVPDVVVAGLQVGPVWFTERPDANFRTQMSAAMDAPVEGALGGNAFHSLRMTVDYVHARAAFSRRVH